MCVPGAQRKGQLGITEKMAREGFTVQVAFELGPQGSDALKRKDKYFLSENVMSQVQEGGKPNPTQQSMQRHFSVA